MPSTYLHGAPRRKSDGHSTKVARITLGELLACGMATDLARCRDGFTAVSRGRMSLTIQVRQRAEPGRSGQSRVISDRA
jgi:hypothetical protein